MSYVSKSLFFSCAALATSFYHSSMVSLSSNLDSYHKIAVTGVYYQKTRKFLVTPYGMDIISNEGSRLSSVISANGKQLTINDFQKCERLPQSPFTKFTKILVEYRQSI